MRYTASTTRKLAGAASILTLTSLMAAGPTQAGVYSDVTAAMKHFIECAGWLVSDPAKHAKYCDPGHTVFVSSSTGNADAEDHE